MYSGSTLCEEKRGEVLTRCLNNRPGERHENPVHAISCARCDYLVQGARVGVYEVVSCIGEGSFGQVYSVREPAPLSRTLALKVLRFDRFNEAALNNFFDEARRIASLQHPNILPVYAFGQLDDERPYLVMEYAPQTLYDVFRRDDGSKRLAFAEELTPYLLEAAEALNYVHKNNLIHQDIKPGNLLVGKNGHILLSDFGATFYLGMQTHATLGEVTGTAAYMPPEHWQGNPRRESDQYALAICCYELLAGRLPFIGKRMEEMWYAHLNEPAPPPHKWNHRVPVEVSAVLLRALAKDYHQRYPGVLAFAEAYKEAAGVALQRFVCQRCGYQNRSGAQRCSECGADHDGRCCLYCQAPARFGQRCCSMCGRLIHPQSIVLHSPLAGVSMRQGRYIIQRVFANKGETNVTVSVACDTQNNDAPVVLKRWETTDQPLAQRAKDIVYYESAVAPLLRLNHPLIPRVLDRFAEGKYYSIALRYIDGESLEERMRRLLQPLPELDVVGYMNTVLNILIALDQQSGRGALRHYDISPATIVIERARGRAMLTGFQITPPPSPELASISNKHRTTRKLAISPYLPVKDTPYDARTCIYALAASMHHAITNVAPPHYPAFPSARMLNPAVSPTFEALLQGALMEDSAARYQTYAALQRDLKQLL